jgi:hypothetical protein
MKKHKINTKRHFICYFKTTGIENNWPKKKKKYARKI